jgi:hypothetical protein
MDLLGLDHIFRVYRLTPDDHGNISRQLLGRFMVHDDNVDILEDYFGVIGEFIEDGPVNEDVQRSISAMKRSAYLDVVSEGDISKGHRMELIPESTDLGSEFETPDAEGENEAEDAPLEQRKHVFEFHQPDLKEPFEVHVQGDKATINGQEITQEEIDHLLQSAQSGKAKLRLKSTS